MQCFQLDFPDGDLINPAYAFQVNVAYVLSDTTYLLGNTIFFLYFEEEFKRRDLMQRAHMVHKFQVNEPETNTAFENFFIQQKQAKSVKHLPNNLYILNKKMQRDMDIILKDWVDKLCKSMKEAGFYAFSHNFDPGILINYFLTSTGLNQQDLLLDDKQLFSNQLLKADMDKMIWLLAEGFYSHQYFSKGAITETNAVEEGKPYLIKCLKVPNINLLNGTELRLVRDAIINHTASFRAEAGAWAKQCYTNKNGIETFKEKLLPLMATVQDAIDNDPLLKQWGNIDSVKNTSAIYFGEVSPEMLWSYYKDNLVLNEELHNQLIEEYAAKENYTIPVMVFAYHLDSLKLKEPPQENEIPQESVKPVRKYVEI